MRYESNTGLIEGAGYIASPNFNERPAGVAPEALIIHAISLPPEDFGGDGVERLFTNRLDPEAHPYYKEIAGLEVSAHLFIRRDGEVIQFVPLDKRAWHAGVSACEGRDNVNDFSIGIELEGSDSQPFEDAQYTRLAEVAQLIMSAFPAITPDRIYGHSDIAPGRKTDPGPHFDWVRFRSLL